MCRVDTSGRGARKLRLWAGDKWFCGELRQCGAHAWCDVLRGAARDDAGLQGNVLLGRTLGACLYGRDVVKAS